MAEVLKTYRDQIDTKIAAEQQSYVDLAKIYDEANAKQVQGAVLLERNKRATATAERLAREKAASPQTKVAWISQIHSEIEQFAEFDFQKSQAVFTGELNAYKTSIAGLTDLTEEQANLDKLKDSLESLAKPQSIFDKLKASAEFGCEVNRNSQLLDVTQESDDLTKRISSETDPDKKKSLEKQKAVLGCHQTRFAQGKGTVEVQGGGCLQLHTGTTTPVSQLNFRPASEPCLKGIGFKSQKGIVSEISR